MDCRALPFHRFDVKTAAALLGKATGHGEAEACSPTCRLGGEKRLGCLCEHLGGHTGAGVRNAKVDIRTWLEIGRMIELALDETCFGGGGKREVALAIHGVASIGREVDKHRLKLSFIGNERQ